MTHFKIYFILQKNLKNQQTYELLIKQYSHCIIQFLKNIISPSPKCCPFLRREKKNQKLKSPPFFEEKKKICLRNLLNPQHWRVLYEGQGTLPLDFAVCIYWEALYVGSWAVVMSTSAASGVSGRSRWRASSLAPVSGPSGLSHSVSERPLCPSILGDLCPPKETIW